MTKDFIAICATALVIDVGAWGLLRPNKPATRLETTATMRVIADDPALRLASEHSPYMRNER